MFINEGSTIIRQLQQIANGEAFNIFGLTFLEPFCSK